MTNRDKLDELSNLELVYLLYHELIPTGKQYANSEKGIIEWLSEEADIEWWGNFRDEAYEYSKFLR